MKLVFSEKDSEKILDIFGEEYFESASRRKFKRNLKLSLVIVMATAVAAIFTLLLF